jgi:Integrase zinc binding domain
MTIAYLPGDDNTVADALSRLPPNCFPDEGAVLTTPLQTTQIAAVLSIASDSSLLKAIKDGYAKDAYCQRLATSAVPGMTVKDGLWYVGERLLIPRIPDVRENLFRLAHDSLGHFGADKSYAALRNAYYWPNMWCDLKQSYIPSCSECQRNKSHTTKPVGLLYPLPVLDGCGNNIAMDFIGPLPIDDSFDCILTITDCLGCNICLVPTRCNITAEELAVIFFDNWYCKNGLPLNIACDHDKLFVSRFWSSLIKLTGVKLKMSSAYHPQTDGASKCTNKTVNQLLRYHV